MITPLGLNDVQLRSGRVLQKKSQKISIQKSKEDKVHENDENIDQENTPLKEYVHIQSKDEKIKQAPTVPLVEQPSIYLHGPPFPERLKIDEGMERKIILLDYDMLDELKKICIKIPLLQAIK